jgi:hypothetical protein
MEREQEAENLRMATDALNGFDPLLGSIEGVRSRITRAERELRLLIAYGREFPRPRPYTLESLAGAAGMSFSGVRTAYNWPEVAEVAERTGTAPANAWKKAENDVPEPSLAT